MKQVVQDLHAGQTRVLDVPVPRAGPGMALVRTGASLVSAGTERMLVEFAEKGLLDKARSRPDLVRQTIEKARREGVLTTLDAVRSRLDQSMPLGYSSAGTVVEVGEGLVGFRVGEPVACAGGGFAVHAEYAVVPKNLMVHLPEAVDFECGSFATLGAIAMHGMRLAAPQVGERVAVIGLGLLGQLAAQMALSAGCSVLGIDLNAMRVQLAGKFGITAVERHEAETAAADISRGRGFDIVLICADTSSSDPVELAGAMARDRGRVVAVGAVGMTIPRKAYYEKELSFMVSRSYGPGRYDPEYEEEGRDYPPGYVRWTEGRNMEAVVALMAEGRLDVRALITHRFPIERAHEAYRLIASEPGEAYLGVILTYPETSLVVEAAAHKVTISTAEVLASRTVRVGALGAGNFATGILFPILRASDGVELVGVATRNGLHAAHAGRRFGFSYATTQESDVLGDGRINTIAILTRHHLHARQVVASLQAGKHVFCEKPLALDAEELTQIAEALRPEGPLLMVGYNRRFAPLAVRLKRFMDSAREPLLMTYRINAGFLPRQHWLQDPRQGGGRLIGEACHFIDFLTWLAGAPPIRMCTRGVPDDGRYSEDNVILTLEFPGGDLGSVLYVANGDRAYSKERVEVFGGGRVAVLEDFRRLDTLADGRRRSWRSWLRQEKGHRQEWEALAKAIANGGPPPIPYPHLFGVALASFAAVASLRSGEPQDVGTLTIG